LATDVATQVHIVGQVNVNTASEAELRKVPGLDAAQIEALLAARQAGPIVDLAPFHLSDESAAHLKTEGQSRLYRIVQNPLRRIDSKVTSRR
jgi:hypothetical protein